MKGSIQITIVALAFLCSCIGMQEHIKEDKKPETTITSIMTPIIVLSFLSGVSYILFKNLDPNRGR